MDKLCRSETKSLRPGAVTGPVAASNGETSHLASFECVTRRSLPYHRLSIHLVDMESLPPPRSGAVEIPGHSMPLVHGLEVQCNPQQRHTGLGLTSLLELTNETLPITPRPTRSPRTAQPPPRLAPATSAPTPTSTCRGACESDLLFPLEMS